MPAEAAALFVGPKFCVNGGFFRNEPAPRSTGLYVMPKPLRRTILSGSVAANPTRGPMSL